MATISDSVKKTKRVIIVEECMKTGGIGASLSSVINESLFDYLDHQARGPRRSAARRVWPPERRSAAEACGAARAVAHDHAVSWHA
jgi:pyruvate/2-oxoglutarate/acetoin dehydrogenase E1 component